MADELLVREALLSDAPAIAALHHATYAVTYRTMLDPSSFPSFDRRRRAWVSLLSEQSATTLVAERLGGALAAFLHASWQESQCHLLALYVDPAFQRRGLGSRLLRELERLTPRAPHVMVLEVLAVNRPAIEFYRSHGFQMSRLAGSRRGADGEAQQIAVMSRESD